MNVTLPLLAGTLVMAAATCWGGTSRWLAANRAVARFDPGSTPGRPVPIPIARALTSAGIATDHRLVLHGWGAAVTLGTIAAALTPGGTILLGVALLAPPGAVLAARGRATRQRARQVPLALDAVAAHLRGGASLRHAIAEAASSVPGPLGTELRSAADRARVGVPLADALSAWVDANDDQPTRLAGAALVVAAELGGPGASAIDAAAASLRDRSEAEDEIAALSVQARLSALLLTAAPIAFAFLLSSLDPASARFLLATPAGWLCITAGLALDAAGAVWMGHIVRSAR